MFLTFTIVYMISMQGGVKIPANLPTDGNNVWSYVLKVLSNKRESGSPFPSSNVRVNLEIIANFSNLS